VALLWQARVRPAPNASADGASLSSDAGAGGARTVPHANAESRPALRVSVFSYVRLCVGTLIGSGLNLLVNKFGASAGCPPAYPHRIAPGKGGNAQYHLCYRDSKSAGAGSGPCGSWCASLGFCRREPNFALSEPSRRYAGARPRNTGRR
jgi:hypothetical protein